MASSRSRLDGLGARVTRERAGRTRSRRSLSRTSDGEPTIRLFGPPAVHVRGDWEALRPGKASALLAFVAARPTAVRRSEVAALLWPESDEHRAHTNLRQLLQSLSAGPLAGCIARDRDTVRSLAASDAVAFERALDEARWADAVALYRGPLLEGFDEIGAGEFSSWLASERTVAEGRWRSACLTLLDTGGGESWPAHALQLSDRLLRADPLDEVALRHAMRAAASLGDVVAARQRFDAFSTALRRDLDTAPDGATMALLDQLEGIAGAVAREHATTAGLAPALARGVAGLPRRPRVIGRSSELRDLSALLDQDDVRIVTLLGPGGIGKTTLAIALAEAVGERFQDGVAFAPLDEVEPDALVPALAHAVGVTLAGAARPLEQLSTALAPRRALLVLDAFDPHTEPVTIVDALLRACPGITLVVTARSRLRLSSEVVYEVAPLTVASEPVTDEPERTPSPAARLLLRSAARSGVTLSPTVEELEGIERVCAAVGGNPLAIELVAAWTDVLSFAEVERQLAESWELLRSDDVDRSARGGDLHATLQATWERLDAADRSAWARLAMLPGSLDRTLAAAVSGTSWRGLRRLVDAALLAHRGDRLQMHTLVARFGRERAAEGGDDALAWELTLRWWLERLGVGVTPEARRGTWHDDDLDQALAAWQWALARERFEDAAALAVGLLRALGRSGRGLDRARAVAEVLPAFEGRHGPGRDLALARTLAFAGGTPGEAAAAAHEALRLAERLDDDLARGCALTALLRTEPTLESESRLAAARDALRRSDDEDGLIDLLLGRASVLIATGRLGDGVALLDEVEPIARSLDAPLALAEARQLRAAGCLQRDQADAAEVHLAEARRLYVSLGGAYRGSGTLANDAWLALVRGERELAERLVDRFVASERRYRDASVVAAALQSGLHAWTGDHARAAAAAEVVLERYGSPGHPSVLGFLAHQRAARAYAGLGRPGPAALHLRAAEAVARACAAPRFVARLAVSAAALAAAVDDGAAVRRFAAAARAHANLEGVLAADVDDLVRSSSDTAGEYREPALPELDDGALLDEVVRFLDGLEADA